jgi:hypothetical protein
MLLLLRRRQRSRLWLLRVDAAHNADADERTASRDARERARMPQPALQGERVAHSSF